MAGYPPDALVTVPPFLRRVEGDEATIADRDRQNFLAIPAQGLDILDSLAAGATVGEAADAFARKYDETPDIEDFLEVLAAEGFVRPAGTAVAEAPAARRRSISFDWIPEHVARRLCGPVALSLCALLVAAGIALLIADPGLLPPADTLLFPGGHFAALSWATAGLAAAAVALHELAHVVVARANGSTARVGLGNVMYTMVAQTDMTPMWLVPARRRYLAFLSGLIVDAASCAVVVGLLYAAGHGYLHLSAGVGVPLLRAVLFTYLLRISFQFFLYLRTDIYYVVATALGCRSLMSDTEAYLRQLVARLLRRDRRPPVLDALPPRERRAVRGYAGVWVLGRSFELVVLITFFLPLLLGLLAEFGRFVTGQDARLGVLDFATVAIIVWLVDGGGIYMWVRNLVRGVRDSRRNSTEAPDVSTAT